MVRSCVIAVALIATLGIACNRNNANRQSSAPGEGGGLSGAANPPAASASTEMRMSQADQQFVQKAAQGNQMEVDLAKMAQDKAQSSEVKDYAKQLEQDHFEALDDLRGVATRASVTIDNTPAAERASMEDTLGNASGRAFDRAYIEQMIDDHRKDIAEFEQMQNTATGELKEYIDRTLPVIREHLQKAEALQSANSNAATNPIDTTPSTPGKTGTKKPR